MYWGIIKLSSQILKSFFLSLECAANGMEWGSLHLGRKRLSRTAELSMFGAVLRIVRSERPMECFAQYMYQLRKKLASAWKIYKGK